MRPRQPPLWLVPALIAMLVVPPAWAIAGLLATALSVAIIRAAGLAARRPQLADRRNDREPIVLGHDQRGRQVVLSDRELSAHGLIVGASGTGKSTTLLAVLAEQIGRGRGVVAIDLKGSPTFARELAAAATAAGREFRLWSPDGPGHWNPLAHGNATELKDKLIATERFTEPHYQRAAERYVQTALQVLLSLSDRPPQPALREPRSPTLDDVVALMEPRRMAALLREVPRPLALRVQDYLASLTPDQLSAVRGLATRLAIISESHVGPYLTPGPPSTIDLRRSLGGGDVVLFSLNSSTYGKLAAQIGTLVVQDLICAVGHRLSETSESPLVEQVTRATIAIDEFSALSAENVVSLLARGREAGVSVLLATQELADLDRAATGLRDQVLGNTAVKIAHRQDVPSSAQTIAQMTGTEKQWEETYQIGRGPLGRHDTSRGTRRQVERFVVDPNQIKSLRAGQAVLISKIAGAGSRTVSVLAPRDPSRER